MAKNVFINSLYLLTAALFIFISFKASAYETVTHEKINEYVAYNAMDDFSLDAYLKEYLGFKKELKNLLSQMKNF